MSKKILLVDDDAMSLRMAQFILKKSPYEILSASSGAECLELLRAQSADLVLLDIEMPDMNGFQTLEQIRDDETLSNIPVIFLTASDGSSSITEADRLKAIGFVKKPFIPQDLLNRVAEVLES